MIHPALLLLALAACHNGPEVCSDGWDNDGDALVDCDDADCATAEACTDADADGWVATEDCDDLVPGAHPGADEVCDGVDNDCDGAIDEGDATDAAVYYADADGDGYGDQGVSAWACTQPSGYVEDATDCDDDDPLAFPESIETCDPGDDDCDGQVDEDAADMPTWYIDHDGDGYGVENDDYHPVACTQPDGFADNPDDCDDTDANVNPGVLWYADADGDGYGNPAVSTAACYAPSGMVADATDCDDTDAGVNPGVPWYADADGDGFGDPAVSTTACYSPSGMVADATDCDDTAADVFPGADEWCDGVDHDCDGLSDEDHSLDATTWYADADGDGYGDAATSQPACTQPSGYVADATDCDDTDASVNPGVVWYADADGDGWGDPAVSTAACYAPSGMVADDTDCDDGAADVFPGADEWCDGVDHDCDGLVNEDSSVNAPTWYADADGDGYGNAASSQPACTQPSGYVADATDCDDGDPAVNPGAAEVCKNFVDDDCDADPTDCTFLPDQSVASADVIFAGEAADDQAYSMTRAGDVNGDGYGDLIVGVSRQDTSGTDAGAAYLVLGGAGLAGGSLALADARYLGETAGDGAGKVHWAGDIDADGFDDLIIGAPGSDASNTDAGAAYLILGSTSPASLSLSDADTRYLGEYVGDAAGYSVSGVGDVNGDAYGDLLIGARYADVGQTDTGVAYLVLGGAHPSDLSLAYADARFGGEGDYDYAGVPVSEVGDLNADGFDDMLFGAAYNCDAGHYAGAVYVVLGNSTPTDISLADADAEYTGETAEDVAGTSLAGVGDVDGDGHADVLIGAFNNGSAGRYAGAAYLVLGSATPEDLSLTDAAARYTGEAAYTYAGRNVSGAGDVNADGWADLLVGAPYSYATGTDSGAAYLILGSATPTSLSLADADARRTGVAAGDLAGMNVNQAGDVDADGFDDFLVGAPGNDSSATDAGAAYLILGLGL